MAKEKLSKAANFVKLAQKRMTKALKAIQGLSNLSASRYEYTPKQIEAMETAFKNALNQCFAGFKGGGGAKESGFKF